MFYSLEETSKKLFRILILFIILNRIDKTFRNNYFRLSKLLFFCFSFMKFLQKPMHIVHTQPLDISFPNTKYAKTDQHLLCRIFFL